MADTVFPPNSVAGKLEKAKATEHDVAQDAREKGADVFEFDANATPEQKAAQVKKVRSERFREAVKPCCRSSVSRASVSQG